MRHFPLIIVAGTLSCSCSFLDSPSGNMGQHRQNSWVQGRREKDSEGKGNVPDTILYVTTVEFEDGYCWQQDADGENAPFSVNAYRNGDRYLSVEGGPGKDVSSWPDMSRIMDGHLYMDFCTDAETIISKDGKERFRYAGREMICGFMTENEDIWTVGQDRSGKGLTFRKNGEIIFENSAGTVIGGISNSCCETGALYRDGEDKVFFFSTVTSVSGRKVYSAYCVRNGLPEQIVLNNNITELYDIRIVNGILYIAANISSKGSYISLFYEDEVTTFDFGGYDCLFSNCRILWSGQEIYVKADWSFNGWNTYGSILWDLGGECLLKSQEGEWMYDFYVNGKDFAFVYPNTGRIFFSIFHRNGDSEEVTGFQSSGKYKFMSNDCATLADNAFLAGLSPSEPSDYPLIVKNLSVTEIPVNGFISSIKVLPEPADQSSD